MALYGLTTYLLAAAVGVERVESPDVGGALVAFLGLQLVGALGEEFGWRGFLQPAFEARIGPIGAATVVGLIWSIWHVDRLADPLMFVGFAIFSIGLSLVMGYLGGGTWWQRGLVAGVVHWLVNVSLSLFTDPAAVLAGDPVAMLPLVLPPVLLIFVVVVLVRRRPSRQG